MPQWLGTLATEHPDFPAPTNTNLTGLQMGAVSPTLAPLGRPTRCFLTGQ
jgi:hypothetical protein